MKSYNTAKAKSTPGIVENFIHNGLLVIEDETAQLASPIFSPTIANRANANIHASLPLLEIKTNLITESNHTENIVPRWLNINTQLET